MTKLILGFALAFTISSCASKPANSNNDELELREKKANMMKEMDDGTAASEANR